MKTIEYRTVDKSTWGAGPWQNEPDKKQWLDEETGYPCLIVRNPVGALCGYVGVSRAHPAFEQDYNDVAADVHGDLTFSGFCHEPEGDDHSQGICHLTEDGERVWWLGFDCAHAFDLCPSMAAYMRFMELSAYGAYRDLSYVASEVQSLARQLKDAAA